MRSSLVVLAGEHGGQAGGELSPIGFGILTLVILLAALIATFAFRSVGTRYRNR